MNFEFSPHIAIQVKDYDQAVDFYENVLGMELIHGDDNETEFRCGEVTIYIERSDEGNTFFEFKVDRIVEAVTRLKKLGCKATDVSTPEGMRSYIIHDPYGLKFHLWEEDKDDTDESSD